MKMNKTFIKDLLVIEPRLFKDDRGFFYESYNKNNLDKVVNVVFVQDNESKSSKGVLRGLHYQINPYSQSKLVKVIEGVVLDVVVDIRKSSPTFGEHLAIELKADISKLNVNGGAMALGHPLGATGAKLMTTLLHELERTNGRYGLQAICEGGGTANATIIERI